MDTSPLIQKSFEVDVAKKYEQVEKKANQAIQSFANLVNELSTMKQLSTGTKAKEQIVRLTGELNNSSVFFAKMIGEELSKLHNIVNTEPSVEKQV